MIKNKAVTNPLINYSVLVTLWSLKENETKSTLITFVLYFTFLFFFQKTASLWGYLVKVKKKNQNHNNGKRKTTTLLFSADSFQLEAFDVLRFERRYALTSFVPLEFVTKHKMYQGPWLVTSSIDPSLPLAVNYWPLSKTSQSLWRRANVSFFTLYSGQFTFQLSC